MLKSIVLTALAVTAFSFSGLSWLKIEKKDRGIFGYKYVTTSTTGPNTLIACSDPGWKSCKMSSLSVTGEVVTDANGTILVINDVQPIEDAVVARITKENPNGSMYYGSDLYVKYSYGADNDHIVIEVYSLYEARILGLL